ncbi:MAG: hypothetical protein IPJ76_11635 [Flavobacteriales bacterium]|nr:MAG: hypothetical protein IPJ76_11635 [Flavobacteriales bacterium]
MMEHLDRRTLEHYAKGQVLGADAHRVEVHLERCSLCREAIDGLKGSSQPLPDLKNPYAQKGSIWLKGSLVIAGCALLLFVTWLLNSTDDELLAVSRPEVSSTPTGHVEVETSLVGPEELPTVQEISRAVPIAMAEQIGHEAVQAKPPIKTEEVVVARDTVFVQRVEVLDIAADRLDDPPREVLERRRDSRQLVFLHDLKLVHPDELYGDDPPAISDLGVSARYADKAAQDAAEPETSPVQYLDHFDGAMAAFARNDHKAALTDLRIVLAQYPNDVNALFYAGLSCYNLGLFRKAQRYFERAAEHEVTTFDEEARWYYALCVERTEGREAARQHFGNVVMGKGFYAAQALERMK